MNADHLPQLRTTVDNARSSLQARVDLGLELLADLESAIPRGEQSYDEIDSRFRSWDRYNELLIRKLFHGDSVATHYSHSKPIIMVRHVHDRFRSIRERLKGALKELEATIEFLELLDESPAAHEASDSAQRDAYFSELCRLTGGRTDVEIASDSIATNLGFPVSVIADIEDFLRAEGLIEFVSFGPTVRLTHAGRKRYEVGGVAPTKSLEASQTIVVHGDVYGPIQQGGVASTQTAHVEPGEGLERARAWVAEFKARLAEGSLALPSPLEHEVADQLDTLDSELSQDEPRPAAVRAGLRAMGRLLESVGGSVIAAGLLEGLSVIVASL